MAFIVREEIEDYAAAHTTPPEPLLAALADETRATLQAPQMLTGTIEGRFLELLVFGMGAQRVLEIGTYSGYSSISMAAGLPDGGRIDTCEISEEHAAVARRYIDQAGSAIGSRSTSGRRRRRSRASRASWISSSSTRTRRTTSTTTRRCCHGSAERGLIVADNTLWSGRVLDDSDDSEGTQAIKAFNERVASDGRVVCVQRPSATASR